jgi:hypothetical protein
MNKRKMKFVYLLVNDNNEWEDMMIILTEEEAIHTSKKYPNVRIEIFSKNNDIGYSPTYCYYKNGELIK